MVLFEVPPHVAFIRYPFPRGKGNTLFWLDSVRRAPPTKRPVISTGSRQRFLSGGVERSH